MVTHDRTFGKVKMARLKVKTRVNARLDVNLYGYLAVSTILYFFMACIKDVKYKSEIIKSLFLFNYDKG